jgi:hypothetical protein
MTETKSIEQIVSIIEKKILFVILEQLPNPDCPRKRDQNNWKIEQVKITLADRLNDKSRAK